MSTGTIKALSAPRVSITFRQYADLLATYLKPQMRLVVVAGLALFANIGLELVNPQILRYFIDEAIAGSPLGRLLTAAALFTAIALVQQVVYVIAEYTSGRVGWTATNALRADLARHCLHLDMSFHNSHTPGEMIERIDGDAEALGSFFSTFVIHILGNAMLLIGILVLLFREDWRAGMALTAFAILTLFILSRLRNVAVAHWKATREASAETYGFLEERLSGREDIRTNAARPYVIRRFYEFLRVWFRKELRASLMTSIVLNTTWFMFAIGRVVALGVGAYLFFNDFVTIGTAYLIFHYTNLLNRPIERFTNQVDALQKATASIVRIQELLHTERVVNDGDTAELPQGPLSVTFNNVSFAYNNGETVLNDVSFELPPGKVLGLLGRTGAGKTSMMRLLFRLYDPDEGSVLLGDQDIRHTTVSDLRTHVAMVTQEVRLFHGTARDNLTFFDRDVPDARLLEIIEDLGLMRWYRALPKGLDTALPPDGGGLSAGEAQLLAFARVFLKDPSVVVLDEASSRLDRSTEQLVERALVKLIKGRTVIVIAHHLVTLNRCDEIIILEDGRIVEHDDRKRLAGDPSTRFHRLLQTGLEEVLA